MWNDKSVAKIWPNVWPESSGPVEFELTVFVPNLFIELTEYDEHSANDR